MPATICLLAGCMTTPVSWSKAGVFVAQGSKDLAECASKANLLHGEPRSDGRLAVDANGLRAKFERCTERKGYKKR